MVQLPSALSLSNRSKRAIFCAALLASSGEAMQLSGVNLNLGRRKCSSLAFKCTGVPMLSCHSPFRAYALNNRGRGKQRRAAAAPLRSFPQLPGGPGRGDGDALLAKLKRDNKVSWGRGSSERRVLTMLSPCGQPSFLFFGRPGTRAATVSPPCSCLRRARVPCEDVYPAPTCLRRQHIPSFNLPTPSTCPLLQRVPCLSVTRFKRVLSSNESPRSSRRHVRTGDTLGQETRSGRGQA